MRNNASRGRRLEKEAPVSKRSKFKMPNMPVDVMAVLQEALNVEAAREVPLCVSVLLDEAAPADLVAFVRASFASASPQARVSVNYFQDAAAVFDPRSDMAVIAAGATPEVGEIVQRLHDAGVPAMVVTTLPETVKNTANLKGFPLSDADVVAPVVADGDIVTLPEPVVVKSSHAHGAQEDGFAAGAGEFAYGEGDPLNLEPYALHEACAAQLRTRMGEWIVETFREKRLAFAQAFDFVRRPLSVESVRATAMQNGVVGLVVFVPGADLPVMTLNQAKMVLQIAAAYGQPLTLDRAKELAGVVGGGFACRAVARQAAGVVPALGWAVKAAVGYAGTAAMGHAAVEYFEAGGNVSGLAAVVSQAREAAGAAVDSTVAGRAAKQTVRTMGSRVKDAALQRAKDTARQAPAKVVSAVGNVAGAAAEAVREVRATDAQRAAQAAARKQTTR